MREKFPGKKKRRFITRYNAKGVKTVPFKTAFLTKKTYVLNGCRENDTEKI